MFSTSNDNTGKLFRTVLTYVTITVAMTVLILSTLLYVNFESIMLQQIYSAEKRSLSQASYGADIMAQSAKSLALQIYMDRDISKLRDSSVPDFMEMNRIKEKLTTIGTQPVTPYIQSIYIYNAVQDMFYTSFHTGVQEIAQKSNTFFDIEIANIIKNISNYRVMYPILRNVRLQTNNSITTNVYTFIFYESMRNGKNIYSSVIINYSDSWLRNMVSEMDRNTNDSVFVSDKSGNIMLAGSSFDLHTNISEKAFMQKILAGSSNEGYFTDVVNEVKSLVIFSVDNNFGWIFVRTIPFDNIMNKIDRMRQYTLLASAVILLAGLAASYASSRRIYRPMLGIISKLSDLENEKKNNSSIIKSEFLKNVLTCSVEYDENMEQKLKNINIPFHCDSRYVLILLVIDRYAAFSSEYSLKERNKIKNSIKRIVSENRLGNVNCEMSDIDDARIAVVLEFEQGISIPRFEEIKYAIENIQQKVKNYLSISLSAAVSTVGNSIDSLACLYDETAVSQHYRLYYGYGCVILPENALRYESVDYEYPVQKEKALIEEMIAGRLNNVNALYNEIISIAAGYSCTNFSLAVMHLAFDIYTSVDNIKNMNGLKIAYGLNSFVTELGRLETLEEINSHFYRLFEMVVREIVKKKNMKFDVLVNKINQIIRMNYSDKDLCINRIAFMLNLTPSYIGQVYNRITCRSIIEAINETRMEKACELLTFTGFSVAEIAEKTGYSNNQYFHRIFKRSFGVTPADYYKNRVG